MLIYVEIDAHEPCMLIQSGEIVYLVIYTVCMLYTNGILMIY